MKELFLKSLTRLALEHTLKELGDRSKYLGASEIGQCPRKTILSKVAPSPADLETLLRFERGHMAEEIAAKALSAAGYTFERQVEVICDDLPIRGHLDFVFTNEARKTKAVLEVKSPGHTPATPYGSWEEQLYLQMGLLARAYPEYRVEKGAILVLNLNDGEVELFNGYSHQEEVFAGLMEKARRIWDEYQSFLHEGVELTTEASPLCGYCEYFDDCPRFAAEEVPELDAAVQELLDLQEREKAIKKKIDLQKKKLFEIASRREAPFKAGGAVIRVASRSRKIVDLQAFKKFLEEQGRSPDEFQEERTYSFLEIKKTV